MSAAVAPGAQDAGSRNASNADPRTDDATLSSGMAPSAPSVSAGVRAAVPASLPASSPTPGSDARQQAISRAMQAFQGLSEQQRQDPQVVMQALDNLRAANGSAILGKIDLDALRNNMSVVLQMSEITRRLQAMRAASLGVASGVSPGASPAEPSSDVREELAEDTTRLRELSSRIRSPWVASQPGAPAP
ncbi:hypothetical protein [Paraburkholderia heleia]|uniref:hypothetical protein n=1 Tax=Paraburkholderia heleia TaxID=634127 RepID=UPI002AB6E4B6|nr:hypothetical protein [Paraburkholderia heleia]